MKCDYCNRTSDECRIKTIKGKAYCPKHMTQYYRNKLGERSIYDRNDVVIEGNIAKIILRDKAQQLLMRKTYQGAWSINGISEKTKTPIMLLLLCLKQKNYTCTG